MKNKLKTALAFYGAYIIVRKTGQVFDAAARTHLQLKKTTTPEQRHAMSFRELAHEVIKANPQMSN